MVSIIEKYSSILREINKKKLENTTQINHIQCIVPPHILMEIAKKGKPKQKACALETLAMSERFRGQREAIGGLQAAVVPTGERQRTIYDAKNGTNLPGVQVRSEGAASTGNIAVDEAFMTALEQHMTSSMKYMNETPLMIEGCDWTQQCIMA